METKICNKCGVEKDIQEFRMKKTRGVYKPYYICKECEQLYRNNNKDYISRYSVEYRKKNKDRIKEYHAQYYKNNKEIINEKHKYYRENNKEKEKVRLSKYYHENLEVERAKRDKWNKSHPEYRKEYYQKNKTIIVKKVREKRHEDNFYRVRDNIRKLIYHALRKGGYTKKSNTYKILGTDYNTFYNHLLKTYYDNYGYEWDGNEDVHIDHIIPLATAKSEEEILKLCHYTNLQLLKAKDNLEKNAKLDWKIIKEDL